MIEICGEMMHSTGTHNSAPVGSNVRRSSKSSQDSLTDMDDEFSSKASTPEVEEEVGERGYKVRRCFWAESSIPKQNASRQKLSSIAKTPPPRRYRHMKIRSHDEILQEQYDALRALLDDRQNLSRKELQEQHVSQTLAMIENYREINKGARARNIIISQSLPQVLRSPRSSSRPASARSNRSRRCSSASYTSPERRSTKKVSFKSSEHDSFSFHLTDQSEYDNYTRQEKDSHNYLATLSSTPISTKKRRQKRPCSAPVKNETLTKVSEQSPREKPGIYEDINGVKHSDFDLKRTHNPDIKHWLKEKEKQIRRQKKEAKELKRKEAEMEEKKAMELEQRKLESLEKVKEWRKSKRKIGLLKRKKQQRRAAATAEPNLPKSVNTDNQAKTTKESVENSKEQPTASRAPVPPFKPRPQSAPVPPSKPKSQPTSLRRSVKPQSVPVETLIKNNPDLRDKLRNLEREKKLKHRQSYDEWCKAKDSEKKVTLRAMREQRMKLEKEISEETARIISEAARRRIDGIRYKGATQEQEQEEKSNAPSKESSKESSKQDTYPNPYRWQSAATENENGRSAKANEKTKPTSPLQPKNASRQPKPSARNIEDKIKPTPNPYQDTFQQPKLRRPKSKLEQGGINGPDFAQFIWKEVNEEAGNRPEPQGADSARTPTTTKYDTSSNSKRRVSPPKSAASPTPKPPTEGKEHNEPVIETASRGGIFSMTSVDVE